MPDQVKDFKEYIMKLNGVVRDKRKVNAIISNAVYLISAGNNDLAITYPTLMAQYTVSTYTDLLVTWTDNLLKVHYFKIFVIKHNCMIGLFRNLLILFFGYLKSLYAMGARKFAVLGTLPLGCLPGARHTGGNFGNICLVPINQVAAIFNQKLSAKLNNLHTILPGAKFVYVDMYNPLLNLINNPRASGNGLT